MKRNWRILPVGLLALTVGGWLVGCAATADRESTGQVIDDSAITTKIKTALIADPQTKARDISVKTYRGVVQLTGVVGSQSEREAADHIARHEEGVRSVRDDLQVNPQSDTVGRAVDDGEITAKVKAALVANPDTKARDIDVTTSQGVVQLSGFVDSNEERDAAARIATSVNGVRAVDNDLSLKSAQ